MATLREIKILFTESIKVKIKSLEAFRGVAATLIILFHSPFYNYGVPSTFIFNSELFVDFFFVLSGFVMSFSYQSKIGVSINLKEFVLRRFSRLYPLHIFMLFLWLPYIVAKYFAFQNGLGGNNPFIQNNISTFVSNLFLFQSLGIHSSLSWNTPSWSISTEFYTYIIFYIYVICSKSHKKIVSSVIISIAAYSLILILSKSNYLLFTYDYGLLRCIGGFFIGVLTYQLYINFKHINFTNFISNILEIVMVLLLIFSVSYSHYSLMNTIITLFCFGSVVLLFAIQRKGIISKYSEYWFFQFLGKLSYSIYLTHLIIVQVIYYIFIIIFHLEPQTLKSGVHVYKGILTSYSFLINFGLILIVITISSITYKYIEMPFQKRIMGFSKRN